MIARQFARQLGAELSMEQDGGAVAMLDFVRPPLHPLLLILDGIGNPHNLGAIARSAAFFGVGAMLLHETPLQAMPTDAAYRVAEGGLELVEGEYSFAGKRFDITRGQIDFRGGALIDPGINIVASTTVNGITANINITGTGQRPQIAFTSTPVLPQDEVLSRLLFGTSITNLSAPEALQLAAAVAALQNGSGGLNPINAVRRAAGLDRLRILPADPQTGQGTSIAAGKYVTRRLYAEIVTDGQGYSATQVEFQVTRWLSLLSSISTLGRQSVNVRVSRDY